MFLPVLLVCTAGACANAVPPPRTAAAPPTTAAAPVLNNSLRETGCPGRSTPDSSSYGLIDMPVSLLRMGGVSARLREVSRLFTDYRVVSIWRNSQCTAMVLLKFHKGFHRPVSCSTTGF